ncbi:MAG: LptF/LptG family permease [Alphaproteobacteria bacterium]
MLSFSTMGRWLSKRFLAGWGLVCLILASLTQAGDMVELLRRSAGRDVDTSSLLALSLLRLPSLIETIFPYSILFAAMMFCWRLSRQSELSVIRAAGVSVWQLLQPVLLVVLALWLGVLVVLNPMASSMYGYSQKLEQRLFQGRDDVMNLSGTGLWLRQQLADGSLVFHASHLKRYSATDDNNADDTPNATDIKNTELLPKKPDVPFNNAGNNSWKIHQLSVFSFDDKGHLTRRIDAPHALLSDKKLEAPHAVENIKGKRAKKWGEVSWKVGFTPKKIQEHFSSPHTVALYRIPEFVRTMEATGISGTRLALRFYSFLAQPLFLAGLVFIAAYFCLRPPRDLRMMMVAALGVGLAFLSFFFSDLVEAFGLSGLVPAFVAAFTPGLVSLFMGIALLLFREEGTG